jgi:hypothetical protein
MQFVNQTNFNLVKQDTKTPNIMLRIEMTPQEHKSRHKMLHEHLDELFADYISHHPQQTKFTEMPIMQLLTWSKEQTENPTEDRT